MALATALIEAPALATAPMSYWRTVAWRLARRGSNPFCAARRTGTQCVAQESLR